MDEEIKTQKQLFQRCREAAAAARAATTAPKAPVLVLDRAAFIAQTQTARPAPAPKKKPAAKKRTPKAKKA